ncbi:DUF7344 domain-containing protein [Haloarcula onubensis]|uniref:DUF7344 domain-containing protein n=1 Tax=Haloarcula onubensis TaxID=2950539 RepID=A0ABU2FPA9_9EURY|nr:hypothetical protein [Halomicroarcula sp. S3CR25-11]MDS0282244.1 hypothetical protein [Halomicroarcula sp. S3CR25-11]
MPDLTETVDWSRIFDALACSYRRQTLRYLTQVNDEARVEDVAVHLAETTAARDRTRVLLHHQHLPKLIDAGLARWDRERDAVSLTPLALEIPIGLLSPQPLTQRSSAEVESASD